MTDLSHIAESLHPLAIPLDDCHLDPANARTGHDIDGIAASLSRYGQRKPIVVNAAEGMKIEAGNGTWQAAKALGWSMIAAVVVSDDNMTAVGYGIADNRIGDKSGWDLETLKALVDSIDPDLDLPTGFADGEIEAMLEAAGIGSGGNEPGDAEPQTNRADELRELWGVELGQMWRLPSRTEGQEHRLICGDCTEGAVVERVMGGEVAELLCTDPPYGIERDGGFGGFGGFGTPIARRQYADDWDSKRPSKKTLDLHINQAKMSIIFGGNFFADILPKSTHWIVWDKLNTMPTFGDCELAWTNSKRKSVKKITFEYNGLIGKEKERFHPTQKPVGLCLLVLEEYSGGGQIVADFYHGSGTTLIAAENLSRQCRAVEISPAYVAVALQRYQDAFGITPELLS